MPVAELDADGERLLDELSFDERDLLRLMTGLPAPLSVGALEDEAPLKGAGLREILDRLRVRRLVTLPPLASLDDAPPETPVGLSDLARQIGGFLERDRP